MNILIAAFYTNDFYGQQTRRLAASLQRLNLSYTINHIPGISAWNEAVSAKPGYIRSWLAGTRMDGIFYTDADSEFIQKPDWKTFQGIDFAAVWWKRSPHHEEEILSGSMYFANNDRVKAFVDEWIELTAKYKHTDTPEQHSLKEYFSRPSCPLLYHKLPIEWCFIHDDHREMYPDAKEIIRHYQASREYKAGEAKAKESAGLGDPRIP